MRKIFKVIIIPFIMVITSLTMVNCDGGDNAEIKIDVVDEENVESDEIKPIHLTQNGIDNVGIRLAEVSEGNIYRTIELLGEITLNEEAICHILPRYSGIVKKVLKPIGSWVKKGEVLAIVENNATLTDFNINAPMSGRIVEKHIVLGEYVSEESALFLIANLSRVWANFEVPLKDADYVRVGLEIKIKAIGLSETITAKISYISPVLNPETRCIVARAVIVNKKNRWKPGTFIKGSFSMKVAENVTRVLRDAVQNVKGKVCVFVPNQEGKFVAVEIVVNAKNTMFAEIVSGLNIGDKYVSKGAFELKSKVIFGNKKAACPCC